MNSFKSFVGAATLIATTVAATGCDPMHAFSPGVTGSGKSRTESRSVGSFSRVQHESAADVSVLVGPKAGVKITADDNILPLISTSVKNDTLVIKSSDSFKPKTKVRVEITTPSLTMAYLLGAGNLKVDRLRARIFAAKLGGAGNVNLNGTCDELRVELSGAGNVQAYNLQAQTVQAVLNGAGNIEVDPHRKLEAQIGGAGNITYKGSPQVDKVVNGAGTIRAKK
ncbi:MAG TPA: head GIN domain-containing protein [Fimbriimonadaceae bacterium]|nr:head GIN domain-containing protein [Fimbriimonadaceae bacterium]